MSDTYTSLYYHVIYATKNRQPWLTPDIEERVWDYHGALATRHEMRLLCIGGFDDHLHALLSMPPALCISRAVKLLKGASSRWIHETYSDRSDFAWQAGFAALTLGRRDLGRTERYIARQREHHASTSFDDELLLFLQTQGIAAHASRQ